MLNGRLFEVNEILDFRFQIFIVFVYESVVSAAPGGPVNP
jgi:hypothetical protein